MAKTSLMLAMSLVIALAAPGGASAKSQPVVTVTFSGSYADSTTNYVGDKDTSSASVSWKETATGRRLG